MKPWRLISVALVVASITPAAARAQQASRSELDSLKRSVEAQEQSIRDLKARIKELEQQAQPLPAPPRVTKPGEAPSPAEEAEASFGRQSPVSYRADFDDKQEAVPRPGDYTLDTKYRGFIPIPHTVFMIKFNPKPRVDMMFDTDKAGNDFRFVPGKIPTGPNAGGGERFNANGNGSQLRLDMRAPGVGGNFRFYYQNDFFGSDSKNFQYRLQHLYGQYYGLVVGYTYGIFEDPDAWPDTVDYEGPSSVIFARRPLLHYIWSVADHLSLTLGIEDPDIFVDTRGNDGHGDNREARFRAPDGGFNLRWEQSDLGHVQFGSIFRSIGINGNTPNDETDGYVGRDQDVFGWGIDLAGSFNLGSSDNTVQFWGVYGQGVGGLGNDAGFYNTDAALDRSGDLVALDYLSAMLAFSHNWTPRWRSTATYGYVNLENVGGQDDDAYDYTHYASVNLVYKVLKRFNVGLEGLYGFHQVKSGHDGDVFRVQLGMVYSIFD